MEPCGWGDLWSHSEDKYTWSEHEHTASLQTLEGGRAREQNFQGTRAWEEAAVIYLQWPLTHGLIELKVLAR